MFKLVTHSISTKSKVPSLSDVIKAAQTKAAMATKTASAQGVAKTASAKSDLVEVEISLKEAGNLSNFGDKKAKPFGKGGKGVGCGGMGADEEIEIELEDDEKKKKPEKSAKANKKASSDEGETSGQPQAEAKLVNDPHKDKKLNKVKSTGKGESDEAESSGQLDVEPLHQEGESTGKEKSDKEAGTLMTAWYKIANLTAENEKFVREELEKFWPKKFVDALLAKR